MSSEMGRITCVSLSDDVRYQVVVMTDQQKLETIRGFCREGTEAFLRQTEDRISRIGSNLLPSYYPARAIAADLLTAQAIVTPRHPNSVVYFGKLSEEIKKFITAKQAQIMAICAVFVAMCLKLQRDAV